MKKSNNKTCAGVFLDEDVNLPSSVTKKNSLNGNLLIILKNLPEQLFPGKPPDGSKRDFKKVKFFKNKFVLVHVFETNSKTKQTKQPVYPIFVNLTLKHLFLGVTWCNFFYLNETKSLDFKISGKIKVYKRLYSNLIAVCIWKSSTEFC